jgi:hypothetical protein
MIASSFIDEAQGSMMLDNEVSSAAPDNVPPGTYLMIHSNNKPGINPDSGNQPGMDTVRPGGGFCGFDHAARAGQATASCQSAGQSARFDINAPLLGRDGSPGLAIARRFRCGIRQYRPIVMAGFAAWICHKITCLDPACFCRMEPWIKSRGCLPQWYASREFAAGLTGLIFE